MLRGLQWFYKQYLRSPADADNVLVSPEFAPDAELSKLPRTLVLTAEFDPLRDEGEAMGHRLAALGVPATVTRFNGTVHGFLSVALTTAAQQAKLRASEWMSEGLAAAGKGNH